jgi:hypothetical protein
MHIWCIKIGIVLVLHSKEAKIGNKTLALHKQETCMPFFVMEIVSNIEGHITRSVTQDI